MLDQLTYEVRDGGHKDRDVTVFALSTCGFCKTCLQFLAEKNVAFKYVYYDLLEGDKKEAVRTELTEKYHERILFPYVIIDGKDVIVGFKEDKIKEKLGIT